jgi:hypothetical protein
VIALAAAARSRRRRTCSRHRRPPPTPSPAGIVRRNARRLRHRPTWNFPHSLLSPTPSDPALPPLLLSASPGGRPPATMRHRDCLHPHSRSPPAGALRLWRGDHHHGVATVLVAALPCRPSVASPNAIVAYARCAHHFTSTAVGPAALGWVWRLGSRGSTTSTATSSSSCSPGITQSSCHTPSVSPPDPKTPLPQVQLQLRGGVKNWVLEWSTVLLELDSG